MSNNGISEHDTRGPFWNEVQSSTILRVVAGSQVHGTGVEQQDDRDEMAVYIPSQERVLGLAPMEHYRYRTRPEGVRSGPGDLDFVAYSLRKFARLACKGNPSVVQMLFVPNDMLIQCDAFGLQLMGARDLFVTKRVIRAYMGYMQHQLERLLGARGQKRVNRPELVEQYGFDTKFAYHVLRLGHEGLELAETGALTLPIAEPMRSYLVGVRTGAVTLEEVEKRADEMLADLEWMHGKSDLPEKPDMVKVDALLTDMHIQWWGWRLTIGSIEADEAVENFDRWAAENAPEFEGLLDARQEDPAG